MMAERGIIFRDSFITTPDKSWFDMSFDFLLSMNFGELVPTACVECMPEDVIHAKTDSFVRLSPLVAPTFGKCNMFNYHFYVRNRSIWTQWESFITDKDQKKSWQQANPLWTPPEMPYIDVRQVLFSSLFCDPDNMIIEIDSVSGWFKQTAYLDPSVWFLVLEADVYTHDGINEIVGYRSAIVPDLSIYNSSNVQTSTEVNEALYVIIPFIPNKDEQIYSNGRYNPFSSGTLFDYLGVDLSGLYFGNPNLLDREYHNMLNETVYSSLALHQYETSPINLEDTYDAKFIQSVSVNLREFMSKHACLGISVAENTTALSSDIYARTFDVTGKIKQSVLSGGSYTYSTLSTTEPELLLTHDNESCKISSLPLRAYWSIYIDYFRDENYINVNPCIDFSRDGNDIDWTQSLSNIFDYLTLQFKAWEHDPYTSALPAPQRGSAVRYLPDSELKAIPSILQTGDIRQDLAWNLTKGELQRTNSGTSYTGSGANTDALVVDLSAATIENLRFASALQTLRETEARSGGRYFELMEAIFGARIDDSKIDRAIYLGGDKSPIQISEVLQTSATQVTDDQPLGQMAGRGISVGSDDKIEYITPDHGFFIEICAVLPRTNYQQGVLPMFRRLVRLDFAIPKFAQLGEESVPQSELWYSAIDSEDDKPLGYQSRYYSMKYLRDRTSGTFKDSLSHWTWSRIFDTPPVIGKQFIEVHPDYRQFAVQDTTQEHVYLHMWHDIQIQRALPVFGLPTLK